MQNLHSVHFYHLQLSYEERSRVDSITKFGVIYLIGVASSMPTVQFQHMFDSGSGSVLAHAELLEHNGQIGVRQVPTHVLF